MCIFVDQKEFINFAKSFITKRIEPIEKDVRHCLRKPYVPFQAFLYCFSAIDLLGAFCSGNASRQTDTTKQFNNYMQRFMKYSEEQARLFQNIFRHKNSWYSIFNCPVIVAVPGTV